MGPVRQEHERERRAVGTDGVARLPRHAAGREALGGVHERPVLRPRLGGEVVGAAALVAGVVVLGPVRQEGGVAVDHQQAADREGDRERRDDEEAHAAPGDVVAPRRTRGLGCGPRRGRLDDGRARGLVVGRPADDLVLDRRRGRDRGHLGLLAPADEPGDPRRDQAHQLRDAERGQEVDHHVPEGQQPEVPRRRLPQQRAQALPLVEGEAADEGDRGHDQRRPAPVPDPCADRDQRERIQPPDRGQEHPVPVGAAHPRQGFVAHVGGVAEVHRQRQQPEGGEQHADDGHGRGSRQVAHRMHDQPDDAAGEDGEHPDHEMARDGQREQRRRDPQRAPAVERARRACRGSTAQARGRS